MSEQWHQHLQNLTLWEQLDRFWNPGQYSCTMPVVPDEVYHWLIGGLICCVAVAVIAIYLLWRTKESSI